MSNPFQMAPAYPPEMTEPMRAELTRLGTKLEGAYGAGKYCKEGGECRDLGQLEDVLKSNRDYAAQLDAWQGWHDTADASRASMACCRTSTCARTACSGGWPRQPASAADSASTVETANRWKPRICCIAECP